MTRYQKVARLAVALWWGFIGVVGTIGFIKGGGKGLPLIVSLVVWVFVVVASWRVFDQIMREKTK